MILPWQLRDEAFQRRILARTALIDSKAPQRDMDALMAIPLVADRPFDADAVFTHCPRGHEAEHEVAHPPVNHDGRPHVARRCGVCGSTWLERLL